MRQTSLIILDQISERIQNNSFEPQIKLIYPKIKQAQQILISQEITQEENNKYLQQLAITFQRSQQNNMKDEDILSNRIACLKDKNDIENDDQNINRKGNDKEIYNDDDNNNDKENDNNDDKEDNKNDNDNDNDNDNKNNNNNNNNNNNYQNNNNNYDNYVESQILNDKYTSQFSAATIEQSQIFNEPLNISSILLEESLKSDIKIWEKVCDVDKSVIGEVEKGFQDIDNQIQQLAAQFDICFSLQQKQDQQQQEFWQLVRGNVFTKFSRRNPKKTMQRLIYYCPFQEAICWRSQQSKQSKLTQMISISNILCIHTNLKRYQSVKKNFQMKDSINSDCFIGIEVKNGRMLELLAIDMKTRNNFVCVLEQLMQNQGRAPRCIIDQNFMMTQYGHDVNSIRRNLDSTKRYFQLAIDKLKQCFIGTTQVMLQQERRKRIQLNQDQNNLIKQNRAKLQDLLFNNERLKSKLNSNCKRKNETNNVEILKLNQIIHSIVELNGDEGILSEFKEDQLQSAFTDSVKLLERIKKQIENAQEVELDLRQQINNISIKTNFQIQQLQIENEQLLLKLNDVNKQIEIKEQQFTDVVQEMRQLQGKVQNILMSQTNKQNQNLIDENNRLKFMLLKKNQDEQKLQIIDRDIENQPPNSARYSNKKKLFSYHF